MALRLTETSGSAEPSAFDFAVRQNATSGSKNPAGASFSPSRRPSSESFRGLVNASFTVSICGVCGYQPAVYHFEG